MNWAVLIPIITQYGIPVAEYIWQKWSSGAAPTQADWDQLRAMINTSRQETDKVLAQQGADVNSVLAQALDAMADAAKPAPAK